MFSIEGYLHVHLKGILALVQTKVLRFNGKKLIVFFIAILE